jgi:hypothetical protein
MLILFILFLLIRLTCTADSELQYVRFPIKRKQHLKQQPCNFKKCRIVSSCFLEITFIFISKTRLSNNMELILRVKMLLS